MPTFDPSWRKQPTHKRDQVSASSVGWGCSKLGRVWYWVPHTCLPAPSLACCRPSPFTLPQPASSCLLFLQYVWGIWDVWVGLLPPPLSSSISLKPVRQGGINSAHLTCFKWCPGKAAILLTFPSPSPVPISSKLLSVQSVLEKRRAGGCSDGSCGLKCMPWGLQNIGTISKCHFSFGHA